MHGAIYIGSQTKYWNKEGDISCPACKGSCNDVHLFLECPTTVQAWKHVEDFWALQQEGHTLLKRYQIKDSFKLFGPPMDPKRKSLEQNVYLFLDLCMGHMQTAIWNAYCSKIHRGTNYTAQSIVEAFNQKIKRSLQYILHAMRRNTYVPSRWGCQKLPYETITKMEIETN